MVVEADVRQALNEVMDPELRRSIMELGMVRNLQVSDKQVSFVLALTTLACPMRDKIAKRGAYGDRGTGPGDRCLDRA